MVFLYGKFTYDYGIEGSASGQSGIRILLVIVLAAVLAAGGYGVAGMCPYRQHKFVMAYCVGRANDLSQISKALQAVITDYKEVFGVRADQVKVAITVRALKKRVDAASTPDSPEVLSCSTSIYIKDLLATTSQASWLAGQYWGSFTSVSVRAGKEVAASKNAKSLGDAEARLEANRAKQENCQPKVTVG